MLLSLLSFSSRMWVNLTCRWLTSSIICVGDLGGWPGSGAEMLLTGYRRKLTGGRDCLLACEVCGRPGNCWSMLSDGRRCLTSVSASDSGMPGRSSANFGRVLDLGEGELGEVASALLRSLSECVVFTRSWPTLEDLDADDVRIGTLAPTIWFGLCGSSGTFESDATGLLVLSASSNPSLRVSRWLTLTSLTVSWWTPLVSLFNDDVDSLLAA